MKIAASLKKIHSLFASRHVFLAAVVLGILISLPSLGRGMLMDDFLHRIIMLNGEKANAFEFIRNGSARTESWLQSGVLPWWTSPQTKMIFFRPVAEWLMKLDYQLWPDNIPLMHLHSVLWYGLLVFVAGLTYRQLLPTRWAAGLAAVLFALDATHGFPVGWVANRSVLPCMVAALLALQCYQRQQFSWQIAGWFFFAVSLGSGEAALAITGYLFAYELFLSDRQWYQRVLRLLPYALLAMTWLVFWKHQGYGTAGTIVYIDPSDDPAWFLSEAAYRLPVYLVGQFLLVAPPVEIFNRWEYTGAHAYALVYALIVVALLAWVFAPLLRRSPLARFLCLGMLIAALPICSAPLAARTLWFVGFGATGLIALFVEQFRSLSLSPARLRYSTVFVGAMMAIHLCLSPLLYVVYGVKAKMIADRMDSRRLQLPDEGPEGRKVLVLSTPSYLYTITYPLVQDQAMSLGAEPTRPKPSITHVRALNEGLGDFDMLRKDADTLVVNGKADFAVLRPSKYGFAAGDRVVLDDVEIIVTAVSPDRSPTQIEYRFKPGALAGYDVLAWHANRFEPAVLPAIGQTAHIEVQ